MIGFEEIPQIDFERFVILAKRRGHGQENVAAAIGVDPGHLRRLMAKRHSPKEDTVRRVIEFAVNVQIDPDEIIARQDWLEFPLSSLSLRRLDDFHTDLRESRELLTVSYCVDSYLQQGWMLEWSNREWLGIRDWGRHQTITRPYRQQQVAARSRGNFIHRIVCPWELFEVAKIQNVYWLEDIRHGIGHYGDITVVTPVRDWAMLAGAISAFLPAACIGWTKISIVDHARILVHVNQQRCLSCQNDGVVRNLLASIDGVIKQVEPSFLSGAKICLATVREATYLMQKRLDTLLRDPLDAERTFARNLIFAKMLTNELPWVPASDIHRKGSKDPDEMLGSDRTSRLGYSMLARERLPRPPSMPLWRR